MWLYFQCSGQGPYFGQMGWFSHFHPEKVPSVLERYTNEILRVNSVIDSHLGKQGTEHLVGDKCTYADLMFVPYARALAIIIAPDIDTTIHKRYTEWVERLYARPAVKKVLNTWDEATARTREKAQ
jgi:glutathione S-transferase